MVSSKLQKSRHDNFDLPILTVCPIPVRLAIGVTFMPGDALTMVGVTTRTPEEGVPVGADVVIFCVAAAAAARAAIPDIPDVVGVPAYKGERNLFQHSI